METQQKSGKEDYHDMVVGHILKNKTNLRDFLGYTIPEKVMKHLDLSTIAYDDTSYIEQKYRKRFSDIVVKTKMEDQRRIFIS